MNVILLGGPGSGKGTQAEAIQTALGLTHIASGDLFRFNLKNRTELGILAEKYMNRGELVPDDVTCGMVNERIARDDCVDGYMLDGFPRNLKQAKALAEITTINTAVLLDVPEEISLERLSGRRQCRECGTIFHLQFVPPKVDGVCDKCGGELYQRDDDKPEAIKERLAIYRAETMPIVGFYEQAGVLVKVDGSAAPDDVAAQIVAKLG